MNSAFLRALSKIFPFCKLNPDDLYERLAKSERMGQLTIDIVNRMHGETIERLQRQEKTFQDLLAEAEFRLRGNVTSVNDDLWTLFRRMNERLILLEHKLSMPAGSMEADDAGEQTDFRNDPFTGLKIAIDPVIVSPSIVKAIEQGQYENTEAMVLTSVVSPRDSVLELGAGLGLVSSVLSRDVCPTHYVAVEADPRLLPIIQRTHILNGVDGVHVLNGVATNEADAIAAGSVGFKIEEDFWGSHRGEGVDSVAVPTLSLNGLLQHHAVTFLVVDIEGGESSLFDGADLSNIRGVALELHRSVIGEAGVRNVFNRLHESGLIHDGERSLRNTLVFLRM